MNAALGYYWICDYSIYFHSLKILVTVIEYSMLFSQIIQITESMLRVEKNRNFDVRLFDELSEEDENDLITVHICIKIIN